MRPKSTSDAIYDGLKETPIVAVAPVMKREWEAWCADGVDGVYSRDA